MFIEKINAMLNLKVNWKEKYEAKQKECDQWEFRYNKLKRQLQAVLEENSN